MTATRPGRIGGFAPIESYAALGDGQTVALVAADGRIDWWPLPAVDSPPAFAALLDSEDGGHLGLAPVGEFTSSRRYLPGTNVLETTLRTSDGVVRVVDALAFGHSGPLPWRELVRRVEGVEGSVRMRWEVHPGTRFGTARPWVERWGSALLVHVGDQHLALRLFDVGEPQVGDAHVVGEFTAEASSRSMFAVTGTDAQPVYLADRDLLEAHLSLTVRRWRDWTGLLDYDGDWRDAVERSALALKLLLYTPTGAIAAAPTTSLPERVGGPKNWDYRYMWVRDTSFAADALMGIGLHEEVQAVMAWLLGTAHRSNPDLKVFYSLDGRVPEELRELDAPGYRGSRPVRSGNSAGSQRQLGTFGDLFDTVWRYVETGHVLDARTGRLLADLADRCCDTWASRDAGIWELPDYQHYTTSKIGCWVALDRALRLHERGQLPTNHETRWRFERSAIKDWVDEHCWSQHKQSYTFYAGTDDLDASTLLAARTGFDRGERLAGTVAAVRRELSRGPLVYRYTGAEQEEGAFLACTFWVVTALVTLGRVDEATALMKDAVETANDVGLLSEQMDPSTGEMLGNFPQGLSHLALVNAACALRGAAHR